MYVTTWRVNLYKKFVGIMLRCTNYEARELT